MGNGRPVSVKFALEMLKKLPGLVIGIKDAPIHVLLKNPELDEFPERLDLWDVALTCIGEDHPSHEPACKEIQSIIGPAQEKVSVALLRKGREEIVL